MTRASSIRLWLHMAIRGLLVLALLAASGLRASPATASVDVPTALAHYDIRVDLNLEATYLTAVETVDYTNNTGAALGSLVFNVPAAYFGGFALSSATVDGAVVRPVMEKQSLEITLPQALPPGGQATVMLQFRLQVPPGDGRYGATLGVIALGDWYPILAVYRDGWQRVAYSDVGDPYFSEVANYDVYIATSSPALVTASGYAVSHDAKTWHFRAQRARDFAMAASRGYDFMSRDVSGTIVTVVYLPEHSAGATRMLSIACDSLKWFSTLVGRYPYSNLTIAETMAERPAHTAQEHSGLIFMRSDMIEYNGLLLEMLTAHEVAHQWFFGVVGSDQVREPWLDEGLVNAMALDYFRQKSAKDYTELWDLWGNFTVPGYLNRSIYEFPKGTSYFDEVYRRGATFVHDLQRLIGADVFYGTLREYYADNQFGIATADDLLARMRAGSSTDPLSLYRGTFDYAFLAAPNPQITVTLPSRIVAGSAISIPVATDQPGTRLRATVDGKAVPVSAAASRLVIVQPTPGEHTLVVEALGPGVGFARQTAVFSATQPEPTPTPPPTATPRPTATPQAPPPPPVSMPLRDREVVWAMIAVLGLAVAGGVTAAAFRPDGRR